MTSHRPNSLGLYARREMLCPCQPYVTFAVSTVLVLVVAACATTSSPPNTKPETSLKSQSTTTFAQVRAAHPTVLSKRGPITPQWPSFDEPPPGARRVVYTSGDLELWGWFAAPPGASAENPVPALVYFHGHHFMQPRDFERLRPFLDDGIAILTATLRGRNGNGGAHELLFGEVDDAAAAVSWLASQPDVDKGKIYSFGHSMGGGVSALLSLLPEVPVRMTASCGAVYSPETFKGWAGGGDSDLVRFDPNDAEEARLRVLLPWADQMVHPHVAFYGVREKTTERNAAAVKAKAQAAGRRFDVQQVPGGHVEALEPALEAWLAHMKEDLARAEVAPGTQAP